MNSLFSSYDLSIQSAYIIRIPSNPVSEKLAGECAASCEKVGMPYAFWEAYDGTKDGITPSSHHRSFMKMLKVTDHYLTRTEVACALSHISLWVKCVEEDKCLMVLEHDALMVKPVERHPLFNAIGYFGCKEQVLEGWRVMQIPPHSSEGPNYHFMNRAHAYSLDPAIAKNMLAHVLKHGINKPLDMLLRADLFALYQPGVFAYDNPNKETTIFSRPTTGRSTVRNDKLTN
jgi:hypothetical protein